MAILLVSVLKRKISKMSKIDVSQWKEFNIGKLFDFYRGKEVAPNRVPDGAIPFISETRANNGMVKLASSEHIFSGKSITVSVNYASTVLYQEKDFCASVNIIVLHNDKLTVNAGLFLVAVISKLHQKYSYNDKVSAFKLKQENIKLPIDSLGNPDWQYMDEYIAKLATQAHTNISLLRQQQKKAPTVNIDRWKEFKIDNLFEKITTKKLPYKTTQLPHHATEDNLIPLVTAGVEHQGRSVYAPKTKDITVLSNCLTISANGANSGATFYQDKPFSILQDAYAIQVKSSINENVSKYEYCFLASVIGKRLQQNDWTNKATWNVVKAKEIRLPVTESDEPDWQYMDEYIAKLATQAHTNINLLRHIVK